MKCVYCQGYGFTDFAECDRCRGTGEAHIEPAPPPPKMIIVDDVTEDLPGDVWNADAD